MSVACADDTCVAMTVITDCTDEVEDGGANANADPYGNADDGADGGTRGSSDDGKDGGADDGADGGTRGSGDGSGGACGRGDDGEDGGGDGCGGADGDTSKAISVVLASTPLPLRVTHFGCQKTQ